MAQPPALDLGPLYRHTVLRSQRPVPAHDTLRLGIADHRLTWGRGAIDTFLCRHHLGGLEIMALGYGAAVEIQAAPFQNFSLIQMPVRGVAEFEADGIHLSLEPGEVAILTPRNDERILWQSGCVQILVKMPHALLQRAAGAANDNQRRLPLPAYKLDPSLARVWHGLLHQMLAAIPLLEGRRTDTPWTQQFGLAAAAFIAHELPSSPAPDQLAADHSHETWAHFEQRVRRHLHEDLTLDALARLLGSSPSALNRLCQRERGTTPMRWLRDLRLQEAKQALERKSASVTDVALALGFGHLGRFSAYYRARYGELPRDTAAKAERSNKPAVDP